MADALEDLLRRSPLTQSQRADVWDAYENTQDADALTAKLQALNVPKQIKASLWDLKESSAKPPAPVIPPVQQAPFPTPGQTARTFAGGAVRAIPGMALGAIEGAAAPMMAVPREIGALVSGGPSPLAQQYREAAGHVRNALAPGDAGPGRRLAEAASAIPGVAPIVQGAERILTPAYKTATAGVGTVTPEEMTGAAETGGAATAALAIPEIGKGVGAISPATVGKVLKFTAKETAKHVVAPGSTVAGKIVSQFVTGPLMRKAGTIAQDMILEAIRKGDLPKAAETVAKVLDKNPELAAAHAQEVAKTFSPIDSTPDAVAARNAAKQARRRVVTAPAEMPPTGGGAAGYAQGLSEGSVAVPQEPVGPPASRMTPEELAAFRQRMAPRMTPEQSRAAIAQRIAETQARRASTPPPVQTVPVPSAVVEQAVTTLENRAKMPVPGNVKPATVFTKPNPTQGAKPLTEAQIVLRGR